MISEITQNQLQEKVQQAGAFIGNTPLFPLHELLDNPSKVKLYAKLEWQQLGGSVKARPAYNIIKEAIASGQLHEGKTLIDASSGNTAIAYASIAAQLGIQTKLFVPANASEERKRILRALGAELVLTSPLESTDGAQVEAEDYAARFPESVFYASQYTNENNWKAHYNTTAIEIWDQTGGAVSHFVAGLGTTGTFVGTSTRLKELNPNIQAVALQPHSPMHGLEGWKHLETARVPTIYNPAIANEIREVYSDVALQYIRAVSERFGLLISPSAAANILGAVKVANELNEGTVVTVLADNADKYGEVIKELFQ